MPSTPRWRLLFVPARSGAENMARDVALQDFSRSSGECVLSVYSWSRPTLSFGRNQTANGLYDAARIAAEGIDVVRRPTGGRAILHDHEITYSATGPDAFAPSLGNAYEKINLVLLNALQRLGVPAELASPDTPAPPPDLAPCFAQPVKGEVVALGRKLVGSAQYRENGAFLQHGSILVNDDQGRLQHLAANGNAMDSDVAPATLSALLGKSVSPECLADAMFDAVRQLQDPRARMMEESEILPLAVEHERQFVDPAWTWRR